MAQTIIMLLCPCGNPFECMFKDRKKNKYCSKDCRMKYRNGVGNPAFNARIAIDTAEQRGDTLRRTGEGKTYIKEGGQHQHITVMEQILGRKLLPGEVVHHIDEDRRNNSPSNLELKNKREHARDHLRYRERDENGRLL